MERTQVLIAGAGPVGAVAAYALARAGIDVVLVERAIDIQEDMRASTIHPPTLDMLAHWGLFDAVEAQGLKAPVYQYRNRRSGDVLRFDMGELADMSAHPYRLQCEQYKLSRICVEALGDRARFGERVTWVEQDAGGVTVHCETALAIKSYRADFLIAADGASSIVRKLLGVDFSGFTYDEKFLTLSTRYPLERHFDDLALVSYIADVEEWCVLLRVPEFWRVLVPADPAMSDADLTGDAKKDRVFGDLLGEAGASIETGHRTVYPVHQRVAERYDHGRILLAGDAAHLNNPLGGFGMNSGIHDVWNIVEKLTRILGEGEAYQPLFAQYDRQRRTIMHEFVQAQTKTNRTDMLDPDRRQAQFEAILADPAQRRAHLMRQSMYDSRAREREIA